MESLLGFAVAAILIVGTPGPATLSVAGVAKAFGFWPAMRYQFGLLSGGSTGQGFLWVLFSGGLWSILSLFDPIVLQVGKVVLSVIALGLLLYVAWKIGSARGELAVKDATTSPGFFQGYLLNLVNPKIYVGMFPLYYSLSFELGWENQPLMFAVKFCVIFTAAFLSHTFWILLGSRLGEIRMTAKASKWLNIGFGLALAAVTVWMAIVLIGELN